MSLVKVLAFILLSISLLACTGRPPATVKYSSYYDFSTIESYSTIDRNSKFAEYQNIGDATRNSIEHAIEQVLDAQGLQYKTSERADVVITYHLIDKISELKKYDNGVKYCRPCLSESDSNVHPKWKIQPGSLVLDVVNRQNSRSVWRSVYPLNIKEKDNSFEIQEKIYKAIESMLTILPKRFSG